MDHRQTPSATSKPSALAASLLALALAASSAQAADPFVTADNPFASGWKSVSSMPAQGLHTDGRTVVAWGDRGFAVSRDSGFTWSQPILPSTGPVGAAGSAPVSIADAVVAGGGQVYVRTIDGAVRGGDGAPRNQLWNVGAISRMAVDGRGVLYAEQADGKETVAIGPTGPTGRAPGRLVAAFKDAAATWDGSRAYHFGGTTGTPISVESGDKRPPAAMAPSSGFGTSVVRDAMGGSWQLRADALVCTGVLKTSLQMLAYGAGNIPAQKADAVGLVQTQKGVQVVVNAGQGFGNALRPIVKENPTGMQSVCQITVEENGTGRYRLLGATPQGLVMYRSP
jgi:hypothetical protein